MLSFSLLNHLITNGLRASGFGLIFNLPANPSPSFFSRRLRPLFLCGLLASGILSHALAQEPPTVQNSEKNGFRIVAENGVFVRSPDGASTRISEPFIEPNTDWRPTGPIQCSWSPDGTFVAVAIPHPRVTEISVFDTNRSLQLRETFLPESSYPKWFTSDVRITADELAPKWKSPTVLPIKTLAILRNGEKKTLARNLVVKGDTFSLPTAK